VFPEFSWRQNTAARDMPARRDRWQRQHTAFIIGHPENPLPDLHSMNALRVVSLASVTVAVGAMVAMAQSTSPAAVQIRPGVYQQGNTIMMAPVQDGATDNGPSISAERRTSLVPFLSAQDREIYARAFDAGEHGDWIGAKGLASQGHDAIAGKLIQWRYLLDKNSGASFVEISAFLANNPNWPARDTLYSRAENAIAPTMDPRAIVAWFGSRDPVSGIGKVRLGEALVATGNAARGNMLIQQGWIESSFDPNQEAAIIAHDGAVLTPDIDAQRLDHLLGRNEITSARREMSRVTADAQQIAQVRIDLKNDLARGLAEANALPDAQQNDPGLVYDRVRALRRQNSLDQIPAVLMRAPLTRVAAEGPAAWWAELNLASRNALQVKDYRTAYLIAANTGLSPQTTSSAGTEFTEAQFLAGWLALRFINDPQKALVHFRALAQAAGRPISKGRAYYWLGRAYEASGANDEAYRAYHTASLTPETFYGQLALARIDSTPHIHLAETPADAATAAYNGDELTHAMHVLGDIGQESLLRTFALQSADAHNSTGYTKAICADLTRMGFREIAVRVAKAASYNGVYLLSYLYPTVSVPAYRGPGTGPDNAYVHGIIRQETEFDPTSVSGPGARGLMQVMPDSGRKAAGQAGLAFRPNDLLTDPSYNMQLGMTEIGFDMVDWGGSLVLTAAAYNAGPNNVAKWLNTYGDPRSPTTDPIDWIESIPFSETRNYVQRVLDNTEVYRTRLSGHEESLRIVDDIYRPRSADVKVLRYSPPLAGGTN
jgi:soluble lytic murein transglycosylase